MNIFKPYYLFYFAFFSLLLSCAGKSRSYVKQDETILKNEINTFMDQWHRDAANADTVYFDKMAANGIYIGTDKSEIWTRDEFKRWSKPFFDKKKAWDFKALKRNIYFSDDQKYAWFDEQLDTWMGVCQSSGVLHRKGSAWEIEHYQLSVTLPNDVTKEFIKMVKEYEKK
ncbi:MAG TPA: nuclear transport factor 2 family protein [Bacteroidia bacterium]